METNPYQPSLILLGEILRRVFLVTPHPNDSLEQLLNKTLASLGESSTPYQDIEVYLAKVRDALNIATELPGFPASGGSDLVQASPNVEAFFENVAFTAFDYVPALVGTTSVTFNSVTMLGTIDFENCGELVSVNFPNLTSLGDGTGNLYLWFSDNPVFTTLYAPLLVSINHDNPTTFAFGLPRNPSLTSVSLPSLVTINGDVDMTGNPALTTLSFPVWVPTPTSVILISGCALTAASVNHILARCVASPTWGNAAETLNLGGGTSAAPTGQGLVDKATLIARGATVITN